MVSGLEGRPALLAVLLGEPLHLKGLSDYKVCVRLKAIASSARYPISLVSAVFGTNRTTLWRWIKRFAAKGLPGLIDESKGYKPRKLNEEQRQQVAGWLKSRSLKVPENIILKFLPAYSPELNPVAKIWQWLKKHVCRNRLFPDMDDLMNTLAEHLANLIPTRFMELCHCSYLLHYKANLVLFGIGFPSWCSRFGKIATIECRKLWHEFVVNYVVILSQAHCKLKIVKGGRKSRR